MLSVHCHAPKLRPETPIWARSPPEPPGTPTEPPETTTEPPRNPLGTPAEPPLEPHQAKPARSMWSLSLLKLSFVGGWINMHTLCAPLFSRRHADRPTKARVKSLPGALVAQGKDFAGYERSHLQVVAELLSARC